MAMSNELSVNDPFSEGNGGVGFWDGSLQPMNLCSVCQTMNPNVLSNLGYREYDKHQPCFSALVNSASDGCDLCALLLEGFVERVKKSESCSIDEVHEKFRDFESKKSISCLIHFNQVVRGLANLEFWIPYTKEGDELVNFSCDYWMASFTLRNLPGSTGDFARTELTPFPDFDLARSWIQLCKKEHPKCVAGDDGDKACALGYAPQGWNMHPDAVNLRQAKAKKPQLPLRVIDVGLEEGETEPFLFISENHTAEYATLSHCWGKHSMPLQTNQLNLKEHVKGICFSSLPATFQDAVIVTRKLGLRYLWIDSLCIIQDSPEDWQNECAKMGGIYQNSTVTIAGAMASDSSTGFLQERSPPQHAARLWEYKNPTEGPAVRVSIRITSEKYGDDETGPYRGSTHEKDIESPLELRGWVFQELLLSTRVLYFGRKRMYWECKTDARHEGFQDYKQPNRRQPNRRGQNQWISNTNVFPAHLLPCRKMFSDWRTWEVWYFLVEEYSSRSLTFPKDKLPALSGLANWLCTGGHGGRMEKLKILLLGKENRGSQKPVNYIAGLVKDDIYVGMSWTTKLDISGDPDANNLGQVPSWSWVSVDSGVHFQALSTRLKKRTFLVGDEALIHSNRMKRIRRIAKGKRMHIHKFKVEFSGPDPFGGIRSCSLLVRAKLKTVLGRWSTYGTLNGKRFETFSGYTLHIWQDKTFEPQYEKEIYELECICVEGGDMGWFGLVVEPITCKPGLKNWTLYKPYQRIGFIMHEMGEESDFFRFTRKKFVELF